MAVAVAADQRMQVLEVLEESALYLAVAVAVAVVELQLAAGVGQAQQALYEFGG